MCGVVGNEAVSLAWGSTNQTLDFACVRRFSGPNPLGALLTRVQRSLNILAKILVQDEIGASRARGESESSGQRRAHKTMVEPGSRPRSDPSPETGIVATAATAEAAGPKKGSNRAGRHSKQEWTEEKVNGDGGGIEGSGGTVGADGVFRRGRQHGAGEAEETRPVGSSEVEGREESRDGEAGGGMKPTGAPGQPSAQGSGERFVAHMSVLTDIFRVEDKVSTKKNEEEKKKDKGFLVASLFDASEGDEGAPSASAEIPSTSNGKMAPALGTSAGTKDTSFSFSFATEELPRDQGSVEGPRKEQEERGTRSSHGGVVVRTQSEPDKAGSGTAPCGALPVLLWRSLDDVMAVASKFVRSGCREDVEAAWLRDRKALTDDFKRKHKDAVKMRRGTRVGTVGAPRSRRQDEAKRRKLGRKGFQQ